MSGLFSEWRAERRERRAAAVYVATLFAEPPESDVSWLAGAATGGDEDRAAWELRYLTRALGLLTAQRDAVDDRTASAVAKALGEALAADPHIAAGMTRVAERQFNVRLRYYAEALEARGDGEALADRLGRALLLTAGAMRPTAEDLARASALTARLLERANAALRQGFGEAQLPDDLPPSKLYPRDAGG
jgi:hypothetical protein